jgi:hypothetical protein
MFLVSKIDIYGYDIGGIIADKLKSGEELEKLNLNNIILKSRSQCKYHILRMEGS